MYCSTSGQRSILLHLINTGQETFLTVPLPVSYLIILQSAGRFVDEIPDMSKYLGFQETLSCSDIYTNIVLYLVCKVKILLPCFQTFLGDYRNRDTSILIIVVQDFDI